MAKKKKEVSIEEKEEKIKSPKVPGPFDIINMMFTNATEFNKLSNAILDKSFFIINRVFAIKYPLQASIFNKNGINSAEVVKSWARFIVSKEGYGKVPYFVYTKGAKKSEDTKEKSIQISKELKNEYCKRYKLSYKDFDDLMEFFKDKFIQDIKRYETIINPEK